MPWRVTGAVWLFCLQILPGAFADDLPGVANANRARVNYMLNCQGCHGPEGVATIEGVVPPMQGSMARFLHVDGGRSFLVQVPGSANAGLGDAALAEVLNWMLWTFDARHVPSDFSPYGAEEVGTLRRTPLDQVIPVRAKLVAALQEAGLAD